MEKEDTGEDVDVDQLQAWSALSPTRGQVIEVFLARSTFRDPVEHWASFVILKVSNWIDGSLARWLWNASTWDAPTIPTMPSWTGLSTTPPILFIYVSQSHAWPRTWTASTPLKAYMQLVSGCGI